MEIPISSYIITLEILDLLFFLIIFIVLVLSYIKLRLNIKGRITRSLNMIVLQISVPKKSDEDAQNKGEKEKESISVMEQLFSSLSNIREEMFKKLLYGPFYLTFEIATPIDSNEISFYVSIPKKFRPIIEKQINSFYPDAEIKQIEDYNIFVPQGGSAASYIVQKRNYVFPIKTYKQLEADPLSSITNALSKIPQGEGASLQIVIKPAGNSWQAESKSRIKDMQKGNGFSDYGK